MLMRHTIDKGKRWVLKHGYYNKPDELMHYGVKGMKWGVRRTPEQLGHKRNTIASAKTKALLVKNEVDKYQNGGPAGNQNCQLCTWSMEAQLRGKKVLPRAVYSPRDPIFGLNGYDIVKNPKKISISNKKDVIDEITSAGDGSRFYTHVNWKNSAGGHEFITTNIGGKLYVVDGQAGLVAEMGSKQAKGYYDDINYKNSFLVRMDDKEFNNDILRYNDNSYQVKWDWEKDIAYMKKHGMLSKEDEDRIR